MLNIKPVVIYIANTRPIGREKLKFADISRKDNTIVKRKKGQLSAKHYTENYRSSSTNTTKNQGPVGFCGDRLFLFVLFLNIIRIPIYMSQSWKLKSPPIQLRPHHFWTYTSNLTTVVNSVLKFMISGTTSILKS